MICQCGFELRNVRISARWLGDATRELQLWVECPQCGLAYAAKKTLRQSQLKPCDAQALPNIVFGATP
jgi:hypothetical protein